MGADDDGAALSRPSRRLHHLQVSQHLLVGLERAGGQGLDAHHREAPVIAVCNRRGAGERVLVLSVVM
jgi:hypothetical protein